MQGAKSQKRDGGGYFQQAASLTILNSNQLLNTHSRTDFKIPIGFQMPLKYSTCAVACGHQSKPLCCSMLCIYGAEEHEEGMAMEPRHGPFVGELILRMRA